MNNVKSLLCTIMVCTFFLLNAVNAQYQVDRNYSAKTIYLKGNKYIKDGLEYKNGFFFQNLKKEMEVSPQAVVEYSRFEKKRISIPISFKSSNHFHKAIWLRNGDALNN